MPADARRSWAARTALGGVLLSLALAWPGAASAQTYTIEQASSRLGTFQLHLSRQAAGTVSDSSVTLSGLANLSDRLVADTAGYARSYRLQGTARGAKIAIAVAFQGGRAIFTIDQAGKRQTLQVALPGPVVILDNNMLDGWQIVAAQLRPGSSAPRTFAVLVPQAARTGTVTFSNRGQATVTVAGVQLKTQRYDATLDIAGQKIALQLWLDQAGGIVVFSQPSAAVRFTRETPAAKRAASAARSREQVMRAALQRALQQQRSCVVERPLQVTSTGQTLAGTLSVPVDAGTAGRPPAPALLLLPGSGAIDRNGNAPPLITNSVYQQLAYALGCQGYAVLRIDKLGIGASTGDGNAVTLQTYARNTADWLALLRSQPGVDPRRVGLMGHSEGGLVALYAVAEGYVQPTVVVLLESPGRPLGQLIVAQIAREARLRGASEAAVEAAEAQAKAAVQAIAASHGTRLELTGTLAKNPLAVAFAHAAGLLRSEFAQDPAALAARVAVPLLVVQGGKDVQVSARNGEALAQAAPQATYLFIPDLEHGLYQTAGPAIDHALPEPGSRLSPVLTQALAAYLAGFLTAAR